MFVSLLNLHSPKRYMKSAVDLGEETEPSKF